MVILFQPLLLHILHTLKKSVLMAIFRGEPGLTGCPSILPLLFLNYASFLDRPKLSMSSFNTIPSGLFGDLLSNSFNLPRHTTFDNIWPNQCHFYVHKVQTISIYSSWSSKSDRPMCLTALHISTDLSYLTMSPFWIILELRMMEFKATTGTKRCAK